MKLHFQAVDLDLYGEGDNVFLALGQIEEKLKVITYTDSVLPEDIAMEWDELFLNLVAGNNFDEKKQYQRLDFSSPEDNFTLTVV